MLYDRSLIRWWSVMNTTTNTCHCLIFVMPWLWSQVPALENSTVQYTSPVDISSFSVLHLSFFKTSTHPKYHLHDLVSKYTYSTHVKIMSFIFEFWRNFLLCISNLFSPQVLTKVLLKLKILPQQNSPWPVIIWVGRIEVHWRIVK